MKIALLCVVYLVLSVAPCAAEWFGDVYAGVSLTDQDDIRAVSRLSGHATYRDVDHDKSLAYGMRFGRYLDSVPFLGFAVDYFTFDPNIPPQSVTVTGCPLPNVCGTNKVGFGSFDVTVRSLSPDLFLRLPLFRSDDAPGGRVQPYVLGGIPLFFNTFTPRNTRLFRNFDGDTDLTWGYKGGAGLAVYVYKNLMLFTEYRFTHANENEFHVRDSFAAKTTVRMELDSHTGLVGISARW
jgi:opacity protein-like surface antigen